MYKKQLFVTIICCVLFQFANAAYLRNVPQTLIQPDGDTLYCFASGDEFHNYLHDAEGYTIIQHPLTGYYVYADKEGENLVPTHHIAGRVDPATVGLVPNLNISPAQILAKRKAWFEATSTSMSAKKDSKTNQGTLNNIVIFIRFQGDNDFTTPISTPQTLLNDATPNTTTMYNYFKSASYNKLEVISHFYPIPTSSTILSYQDINAIGYYQRYHATTNPIGYQEGDQAGRTSREHSLLERAVNAVRNQISTDLNIDYDNDGHVDNVCFIIKASSGGWADLLWPHRWTLDSKNVTINGKRVFDYNFNLSTTGNLDVSTFCHEMFHTLGAPDLYHYNAPYDQLSPVGRWDLMERNATPPQHSGAYIKLKYGKWITDEDIVEITAAGTYTLRPLALGNKNICYKIATGHPSQYYYLEYRHRSSSYFESGIPGNGLLIYRINTHCNSGGVCEGNADYNGLNVLDEVYIFRPGGSTNDNGNINDAHFSTAVNRDAFNETTNSRPFLADGTPGFLDISDIIEFDGDSLQFTYNTTRHLEISDEYLNLPNRLSKTASFSIESNTIWSIRSTGGWFSLSKYSGNGNDLITLSVTNYNSSEDYRYDTLFIKGVSASEQRVYVRQDPLSFSVSPNTIEVQREATTRTIMVSSVANWNVLNLSDFLCDWITASPMTGGFGETDVTLSFREFTGTGERNYKLGFNSGGVQQYIEITQTDKVGIDAINQGSVKIYPNPANNILCVNNEELNRTITGFVLYDIYGRSILQNNVADNAFDIDIKKYESGVYILQLQFDDHSTCISKIIKQ